MMFMLYGWFCYFTGIALGLYIGLQYKKVKEEEDFLI